MAPAVHLRSVVALVGRFPALAGADLDVETGEILLVRGPNGAGKTTLLRACAGLVPLVSGEATVLGHDLRRDRRSLRRHVGLLGHRGFLYDDLTVEENVRFAARSARSARSAGAPRADVKAVLAGLGLAPRLGQVAVARLSAGQRRRVALAALVVRRPALWLLDEPHAGLDAEGRELLDHLLRQSVGDGATVVFASHEGDRAIDLAHRAVTMAGGRLRPAVPREPVHVA